MSSSHSPTVTSTVLTLQTDTDVWAWFFVSGFLHFLVYLAPGRRSFCLLLSHISVFCWFHFYCFSFKARILR